MSESESEETKRFIVTFAYEVIQGTEKSKHFMGISYDATIETTTTEILEYVTKQIPEGSAITFWRIDEDSMERFFK